MLAQYWLNYDKAPVTSVADGIERRLISTDSLMLVVVDFYNGPTTEPDPLHHHVHEQVSFVAEGEVLLFAGDNPAVHLKKGDMFAMKSDLPHAIQLLTKHVRLIDCFTPLRQEFIND
jgi:quercetin dioxygenase-like cupin family protein